MKNRHIGFGDHSIFINGYEIYNDDSDGATTYKILKNSLEVGSRLKLNKAVYCCENNNFDCKHEDVGLNFNKEPFYCYDCGMFLR